MLAEAETCVILSKGTREMAGADPGFPVGGVPTLQGAPT